MTFIIGAVDVNLRSGLARQHGVDVFERAYHRAPARGEHEGAGGPDFGSLRRFGGAPAVGSMLAVTLGADDAIVVGSEGS